MIHCFAVSSAGIGRTGSFIALDCALEQAKKEGVVDVMRIVNNLRQQRMKMVQTLVSAFVHTAHIVYMHKVFTQRYSVYIIMESFLQAYHCKPCTCD